MPSRIAIPPFRTWADQTQWAAHHLPRYWKNLTTISFIPTDVTSEHTGRYNCIAYAAKDDTVWWWPYDATMAFAPHSHWPIAPVWPPTVQNFMDAFETLEFERCRSGKLQFGYEKVAIYVDANDVPQHMARELGDGVWYSKLGGCQDIRHYVLSAVEDYEDYGKAKYFMRKRIPGVSRWQIRKRIARIFKGSRR